ncbi:MAG: LysM peptidoglycan-binding domain-containing protein [Nitrospira sp.]
MKVRLILVLFLLVVALALPTAAQAAPSDSGGGGFWHLVKRGETVSSIARHYGVSVSAIAGVNGLKNVNRIWAGTYLWIPKTHVPPHFPPGPTCQTKYTVRHGDTLGKIAHWHGVTVWRLAWNNGIKNYDLIFPGQRLCIPWPGTPK